MLFAAISAISALPGIARWFGLIMGCMDTAYYHAGPQGLTELRPLGMLVRDGIYTTDQVEDAWYAKWGDRIMWSEIKTHPTLKEISLTTDLAEATEIAGRIDGCVYAVRPQRISRINEEGYPVCRGPIPCSVMVAV